MEVIAGTKSQDEKTKTPLLPQGEQLGSDQPPAVVPMKRRDISRAADTIHNAYLHHDLITYFSSADTAPFRATRAKARYALAFDGGICQNRVLTVDGGMSALKYQVPRGRKDPWPHVFAEAVLRKLTDTRELVKRTREFADTTKALVVDAFGSTVADMYEIQGLGTAPEVQGRGYASALVTAVTDLADADGHDVWVVTTDAYTFYERLGFSVVRSATVGDANPAWEGAPIVVRIVRLTFAVFTRYTVMSERSLVVDAPTHQRIPVW
ncbi:hypothetical protein BC628DRAFT_1310214 [Trametes gibbosa]|nr:hypothetical protein BC628DRAFT_1310214 [Trametes gibbosa]